MLNLPYAKDNAIQLILNNGQATTAHYLIGNESRLKHLFLNLFKYPLKAMVEEGKIVAFTRTNCNELEVLISNLDS